MDGKPYQLNDLRRAAEHRRKAGRALTEQARRMHIELAEMIEARTGVSPAGADRSNVVELRPATTPPPLQRAAAGGRSKAGARAAAKGRAKG